MLNYLSNETLKEVIGGQDISEFTLLLAARLGSVGPVELPALENSTNIVGTTIGGGTIVKISGTFADGSNWLFVFNKNNNTVTIDSHDFGDQVIKNFIPA